ncbi:LacI family DNA-binding transcriptional regulator [Rubellimicrobium arenae]|uniref:LacI family DNA-binding transcriptional regulator n=1 Tax=Rubellimicrobium arenae TaxID=2817372 RepID=UPI001B3180C2|nr:LacI family DNA-binding transcriptional regulator [Rubellimicrobium arenae]
MAGSPEHRLPAPTIDDVARLAGVSRATASRALFSEKRPVSALNRERVLAAADQLGYRINPMARSLTTKTVDLVAVLVNHIHDLSDLDLFDLLIAETQAVGKQVILIRIGSGDRVEEFLRRGIAYHVDAALVFSDFADAGTVRRLFHSDHVLMLNGRHDRLSPAIMPDEATGIGAAAADAAAKGVRTAALVTGRASSLVEQARIDLYHQALARCGIELRRTIRGDYSYASGRDAGNLMAGPDAPDAVFCTSDATAMGILDARREDFPEGQPRRFRLYGFDNISLLEFGAYPISSIGYDKAAYLGEMMRFLRDPEGFAPAGSPVLVPTRFVARATG